MTHPQKKNNIKNAPPILLSVLAVTCVLILSGCNGGSSAAATTTTTTTATTTGTGTAAVATATASAAPAKISVVTAN
ncbi:MAG: hypothetical protein R8K20_04935 [Gallionellaceae bacterium]